MVNVMRPSPADTIIDPACGTGGFLLAAHEYIRMYDLKVLDEPEGKTQEES